MDEGLGAAPEVCNNLDDNCNAVVDEGFDADNDGFTSCDAPVADCNDGDMAIFPGAVEVCDGIDNDCDGATDEDFDVDGDTFTTCTTPVADCNDNNVNVFPGADEECNLVDDDCDTITDEGYPVPIACGTGACAQAGQEVCVNGASTSDCTPLSPADEDTCGDGIDNDCDGVTDNGPDEVRAALQR